MINKIKQIKKKKVLVILAIVTLLIAVFLYRHSLDVGKDLVSNCKIVNPETDIKKGISQEECAKNEICHLSTYLSIEDMQVSILSKIGSDVKSAEQLKDEGIDVFSTATYLRSTKEEKYDTVLETLTHGEAILSNNVIDFSEDDFKSFYENSAQREPVQFLRKTFDDYIANKPINILDENITKKCHIVYDETIGLDGFSKDYFKSRFVPLAIYRHVSGGYDIFLFFIDKPDKLFRVWVGYDKKSDFQLKIIKDAGIPKEEIDTLNSMFKKAIKDKRFSL